MRRETQTRVNLGHWLGKLANFKGPNNRRYSDIERTYHVTLTVHNNPRWRKAFTEELFVFGEDFEAILDALEEDEALDLQFTTKAQDVSRKIYNFVLIF